MAQTKTANEVSSQTCVTESATSTQRTQSKKANSQQERREFKAVKGWNELHLARALGWFSLGMGMAQVLAPRAVAQMIGLPPQHNGLFRLLGTREIASGIGILTTQQPVHSAWSRVAGDAMDLALLGVAMTAPKSNRGRLVVTTAAVAGVTALDLFCSQQLSRQDNANTPGAALRVDQTIIINRSPQELYQFWRDFQNLPRFMKHLEAVQVSDKTHSHWVANGPLGTTVEWDAEIIEDKSNEVIAWRSVEGATVESAGSVRFERAPGQRGTMVRVQMQYNPPAGVLGASVAKLLGTDPEWQIKDSLRRFKQVMEVGEVITTEGQSAGRSSGTSWKYDTTSRK